MNGLLAVPLAAIPSPEQGVWHLGPFPIRAYALCIIAGIFVAVLMGDRRWQARGGREGTIADVAVWAVPFGVVGARLYHVLSSPDAYFGEGGDPLLALQIWRGGLGVWGGIALGAVGAWIACRRRGIPLPALGDAVAPGVAVAQALGRLGNWFNQEVFGRPTTLPWGLEIDPQHRPQGFEDYETFHPAFLYEFVWNLGVAALVLWADRRFRLGHGRAFALYVAAYTLGRLWIEALRIDDAELVLGLRLNIWTSVIVFTGAVTYFVVSARLRPGREDVVEPASAGADEPDREATGEPAEGREASNDSGRSGSAG